VSVRDDKSQIYLACLFKYCVSTRTVWSRVG